MFTKKLTVGLFIFALCSVAPIGLVSAALAAPKATGWKVELKDDSASAVEFHATGKPSALKIVGKGTAPHGAFTVSSGTLTGSATFEMASLKTGIDMRDRHMKEKYLETGKYPEARLTLTQAKLPADVAHGGSFTAANVPFAGTLLLHGVEKPVTGTMKVSSDGKMAQIDAQFGLKLEDYGIVVPSFSGITIANDVSVSVVTKGTVGS